MHNKIQRKGKIFQEKIQKIDRMIYLTDLHRYTLLYNNNRNFMSNFEVDKDKYIRKLLKMMNEREKEIQNLKRQLRANKERTAGVDKECEGKRTIDETIKQELYLTSSQLKEVTMQMNTMQSKMVELQIGLEQQINKNNELQAQITSLQTQNQRLKDQKEQLLNQNIQLKEDNSRHRETVLKTQIEFQEISSQVRTLFEKLDALRGSQEILRAEKNDLVAEIDQIRQRQLRNNLQRIQLEKQVSYLKVELVQKHNEIQMKDKELAFKQKEIEQKDQQIAENGKEIQDINSTMNEIKASYRKLEKDLQEKINQLQLKSREAHHLSESLKDYEEFSFEISKYIESTYLKHCCQGHLRSSKKIIKEVQKNQTMFESSFKKMTEIQNWMDDKAEKLQKLIQQNALPEQTLDGISMINRSLVQKVQICDLTQQLEKEKEQLEIIENQVLNNLQKDIEKSYERERSHIVQLGQVREVLKMTKDVNRQLFEQVNKQNCVINECKKIYEKCLPRNSQEFHLMKRILDQI